MKAELVKVAVSAAPYQIDRPYDYVVPEELLRWAVPGVRAAVPFGRGNRTSEGVILARQSGERLPQHKPLLQVLDTAPVLDRQEIELALWMRQRYFCTLFEAVKTILPTGLWYRLREVWRLPDWMEPTAARSLCSGIPKSEGVLDALIAQGGSAELEVLRDLCGEGIAPTLKAMRQAGVITCETESKRKIGDKTRRMAELAVDPAEALASSQGRRTSPQRRAVLSLLSDAGGRLSVQEILYFTGVSPQVLRGMERAGLLTFSEEEELRVPAPQELEPGPPIVLNQEQQTAFEQILQLTQTNRPEAVLLQGVTGSGKTQVYLRLVQEVLKAGRTAIVLVPEIVLTPQLLRRFAAYFGEQAAMLHSGLRMSERYDQWKRIRRGEVRVVLGTRSAIFAPLKNLGILILDEEQESSYQSETMPRYHTRDIAKYLCARDGATVVFGSATPAIETAWAAQQGRYHLAQLRSRYNAHSLPHVIIADLREEIRAGNPGLIGAQLRRELTENLQRGEQSILFLNRRGSSRMLLCGECGHVPECPRCSVPMTYHSANGRLMCHYCGHSQRSSDTCPVCGGIMKHVGTGTQKVEEELHGLFPDTEILRMDADTAAGGHERLLTRFERERIPILLGTQMVAKGLDFENVTLVGVLAADLSLYVDNYRAAERTFSLLTQVVGRAGRGDRQGRAVIQTYTPENDVIQCAARQDYAQFYRSEIQMRRVRRYPPFADLFTVTVSGAEESRVLRAAVFIRERLRQLCPPPENEVVGPAPAPVLKLNNRFRYRCTLVGRNDKTTRAQLSGLLREFAEQNTHRGLSISIDCNTME